MKNYFLIVDTETTQDNLVADFGAVICDAKGQIMTQCAVLIGGIYNNPDHPLFFDSTAPSDAIWSKAGQDRRYATYNNMLQSGSRMLASVNAVNNWLAKAASQFNPILTAYNLPFDRDKCSKTGIDLTLFDRSFCLWAKAWELIGQGRDYKKFVLANSHIDGIEYQTIMDTDTELVLSDGVENLSVIRTGRTVFTLHTIHIALTEHQSMLEDMKELVP